MEAAKTLPGSCAALLWLCCLCCVFVLLVFQSLLPNYLGAVLTTHLEQLLCLQTVLGTSMLLERTKPSIPVSLHRPYGKSWDLLFIARDRTDILTGWKYSIYPGRQYSKPNLKPRARIVQSDNRELARACSSKSTLWSGSSPPCHPCSCCWKKLCGSVCCYPEDRISNMFMASMKGVRGTVAQAKKISKSS